MPFNRLLTAGVGIGLATLLFIRRMAELTGTQPVTPASCKHLTDLPEHVAAYDINGPIFLGRRRRP